MKVKGTINLSLDLIVKEIEFHTGELPLDVERTVKDAFNLLVLYSGADGLATLGDSLESQQVRAVGKLIDQYITPYGWASIRYITHGTVTGNGILIKLY